MKKIVTLIIIVLYTLPILAATQGVLTVQTATSKAGGPYDPRHCVVVWIEDAAGNFVKTLLVYAKNYKTHLNIWQASTSKAGSEYNSVDAISGASRTVHSPITCTWNAKDFNGNIVPDGDYKVRMELTDKNATGNYSSFTITKSTSGFTQNPASVPSFSAITFKWEPKLDDVNYAIPEITDFSADEEVCVGKAFSMNVTVKPGNWYYHWYKNGKIIAINNPTLSVKAATKGNAGEYYCIVSNTAKKDSVKSKSINLQVYEKSTISQQPQSAKVKLGSKVDFSVKITATAPTDFQPEVVWYKGGAILKATSNIKFTNNYADNEFILSFNSITKNDFYENYYVKIKGFCDNALYSSENFSITEQIDSTKISVTSQPQNMKICEDGTTQFDFKVEKQGNGAIDFQWYSGKTALSDDLNYTGTKTESLKIADAKTELEGSYHCIVNVSPDNYSIESEKAILDVNSKPRIISQSQAIVDSDSNGKTILFVQTEGDELYHQWYNNNDILQGENNDSLIIDNFKSSDLGDYYCKVSNQCDTIQSEKIILVDIDENQNAFSDLRVFPNPVRNDADIVFNVAANKLVNLYFVETTGKLINKISLQFQSAGSKTINLKFKDYGLSSGTYFIVMSSENSIQSTKIIIE